MLTTKAKIRIASALSRIVRTTRALLGYPNNQVLAKRGGTNWRLDLEEGIDFAIFLGLYERSTSKAIGRSVQLGQVVLDVGANIGTHTLELARLVGATGKVFAFEPTSYAYAKLLGNLALNPPLVPVVKAEQLMLAASDTETLENQIHSSWPLVPSNNLHAEHLGRLQSTAGARAISLDTYLKQAGVSRIDFVKLDVDGFECEVLEGARRSLDKFRPIILMELAPYVLKERGSSLGKLVEILHRSKYRFWSLNGKLLATGAAKLAENIATGSSINVIARPMP